MEVPPNQIIKDPTSSGNLSQLRDMHKEMEVHRCCDTDTILSTHTHTHLQKHTHTPHTHTHTHTHTLADTYTPHTQNNKK